MSSNSSMNGASTPYGPRAAPDWLALTADGPDARCAALAAAFARIDAIEPQIGAFTAIASRDSARAVAAAASGALAGMPVAVKDIFDTHDLSTCFGSPIYRGHRPASDAAIVTLLRRQGAVIVGKTVTSEFAYMAPTVTRNPCDVARTAGGSSSGSAAAVAAGMVPFAIGSQTGGSTIRPASFCGIAGFKPGFGLLPTAGMKCFSWSFDTVGLFAARVRDVAYLAQALSGRAFALGDTSRAPVFGVPDGYPWTEPSSNAQTVLDTAIRAIERAGGRVRSIRFPSWMASMIGAHEIIQQFEAWRTLGYEYDHHREALTPMLSAFMARAAQTDATAYDAACASMREAKAALGDLFGDLSAILTPSAPDEAPDGLGWTGDPAFNRNWTLLGSPCVNVPGLRGARGGPIGVQVIGRSGDDAACLAAAAYVERAIVEHAS